MSNKEIINQLAKDPVKGRLLSAQMLLAQRSGANPVILANGRRIELKRVTQLRKPGESTGV
jgi:hypothetical protein